MLPVLPYCKRRTGRSCDYQVRHQQEYDPMSETGMNALADRMQIRELIDSYSNMVTRRDLAGLPDLFAEDCTWRTRGTNRRDFEGRDAVIAAIRGVVDSYPVIFQTPHAPHIALDGDTASGSGLINELLRIDDEKGRMGYAIYHDRFVRIGEGWKFSERVFRGYYRENIAMPGEDGPLSEI